MECRVVLVAQAISVSAFSRTRTSASTLQTSITRCLPKILACHLLAHQAEYKVLQGAPQNGILPPASHQTQLSGHSIPVSTQAMARAQYVIQLPDLHHLRRKSPGRAIYSKAVQKVERDPFQSLSASPWRLSTLSSEWRRRFKMLLQRRLANLTGLTMVVSRPRSKPDRDGKFPKKWLERAWTMFSYLLGSRQ